MNRADVERARRHIATVQLFQAIALIALLLVAVPAAAQLPAPPFAPPGPPPTARLIEWDLPAQADAGPGAMIVDTQGRDRNRVWFVTRQGVPQANVYRLDPAKSLMKGWAHWTSWQLSLNSMITGGLRKVRASYDRRFVFVRTMNALERIDTQNCASGPPQTCERLVWIDESDDALSSTSDVAVDDVNNVYTAHSVDPLDPTTSFIRRLTPGATPTSPATITKWVVGGGAGVCPSTMTPFVGPCVSGIAVHPSYRNLVYYSEPSGNNIAELDVNANTIRRWSLDSLNQSGDAPVNEPRQLHIDKRGKIWVVTGSGHLVSLDPCANRLTKHQMPDANLADPFGVAPDDDVVGYTASGTNKVGMVFPKGTPYCVYPSTQCNVSHPTSCITPDPQRAIVGSGNVPPIGKTVDAQLTTKSDGTYIEAIINMTNDSSVPLGISPNKSKAQGTFFYAVGINGGGTNPDQSAVADRVGFVRLPIIREKIKCPRDDDDKDDGFDGDDSGWHGWHGHSGDHDGDDDGVDDDKDSPQRETVQSSGDSSTLGAGQTMDFPMTASLTTVALIAATKADDPLANIGIDIVNPLGIVVASSLPTPGVAVAQLALPAAAGNYTARVHNYGGLPVTHTPTLINREPWD